MEKLPARIGAFVSDELFRSSLSELDIFEIRLRRGRGSVIVQKRGICPMSVSLTDEDMNEILMSLSGGAIYAHRDTIAEGYISPLPGVRVGISGRARYDGGEVVGVSDIFAFIFRIPHTGCHFGVELYGIYRALGKGGMLIYSPPGGGKTTAVRDLAGRIGKGGTHVVAVDERCEFLYEEYEGAEVDVLRGYKKSKGIEIAVRTLGAEVVVVDELSASEAEAVLSSLTVGVPFIATVHAEGAREILERPAFSPFLKSGAFQTLVGIRRRGEGWHLESTRVQKMELSREKSLLV